MSYLKATFGLLLSLLIFVSPSLGQTKKAPPPPPGGSSNQGLSKNSKAPNFTYETLSGNKIKLSNYRGQYILIDFWGTWCKPCLKEMPYLKQAYSKYGDRVKFIGVAADDNKKAVLNYVNKHDIPWSQIVVPLNSKKPAKIIRKYNVRMFPSIFLIAPNGNVQNGAHSSKEMSKLRGQHLIKSLGKALN